jgi:hypothetical protein
MNQKRAQRRFIKKRVCHLLSLSDPVERKKGLFSLPLRGTINALLSFLYELNDAIRWRAVLSLGETVAILAQEDMEAARVIIRRLMWSLNEDSGATGWGAPEALGQILASHRGLAEEFLPIVVSYLSEGETFLDNPVLRRGALWAVARLCFAYPETLCERGILKKLTPLLQSSDPILKGLAVWALGALGDPEVTPLVSGLLSDHTSISFMDSSGRLMEITVGALARGALRRLSFHAP